MRKKVLTMMLLCGIALGGTGCVTAQLGAQQVGGSEKATWVFVHTDNKSVTGIYRCRDDVAVTCVKARINN